MTPGDARITRPDGELARAPRWTWLLDRLRREGRIDVLTTAGLLQVAPETIRRDLRALEGEGKLQRVHGGAVPVQAPTDDGALTEADPALDFGQRLWHRLPKTGTLLIGSGWPGTCLAQAISAEPPTEAGLIVLTRAVDAAIAVSRAPTVEVYNLGGVVAAGDHLQSGDWARSELQRFRVDLAVLCPDGVCVETGLSQTRPAAAAMAEAEIGSATQILVVADEASLGRPAFVSYAPIDRVDELVVASGLSDETNARAEIEKILGQGVRISEI